MTTFKHLGADLYEPLPAVDTSTLRLPGRYRVVEETVLREPHPLFAKRGTMGYDAAREMLEARMHFYDSIAGYSVLDGHNGMYFDVWCGGKRMAVVRIEEVETTI
jgi:hypothetical protein